MSDRETLKAELWACVEEAAKYDEHREDLTAAVREAAEKLAEFTPVPEPINDQLKAQGHWVSHYAYFAAMHSRGQKMPCPSNLAIQSFGNLPMTPVTHLQAKQEIHADTQAYNNINLLESEDGSTRAYAIVYGKYKADEENPQRYVVDFYKYELRAADDATSEADLRKAFSLEDDTPLSGEFKPPKLHSDIVYVDEDTRINFGGLGGTYVQKLGPDSDAVTIPLN